MSSIALPQKAQQALQPKWAMMNASRGGIIAELSVKPTPIQAKANARFLLNQFDTNVFAMRPSVPCPATRNNTSTSNNVSGPFTHELRKHASAIKKPATRLAFFCPSESTYIPMNGIKHAVMPLEIAKSVESNDREIPSVLTYSFTNAESANV